MQDSYLIHEQVLEELDSIDGIVAYSLFQLPEDRVARSKIYKRIIALNKAYYFAVEGLRINSLEDCESIETIWRIRQTLKYCYLATS